MTEKFDAAAHSDVQPRDSNSTSNPHEFQQPTQNEHVDEALTPVEQQPGDDQIESSGDGTNTAQHVLHGAPLMLCSISLLVCMFLVALDQTIVATLLTTVGDKFGDFSKINWIATGFLLPTAVLAMNWGKISMIFGRKYTMLLAIVLFEVGSLVCALANSMNMLIGGRVLAGVGGGGIQVMVFVILTEIVTIDKRGMVQGIVGASFGFASVIGPLLGGAFTSHVTWRWCFYINLPFGGVAFALIFYLFNPPRPQGSLKEKMGKIDYIGTLLLTAGLVLVLLALTFGSDTDPWNSPIVISFFVIGGCFLVAYFTYNFTISKNPMMPIWICKLWIVLAPCFTFFFIFGAFFAAVLYLATFFQVAKNQDAMHSGISLLPTIIALVITSIVCGVAVSKTRYTKPFAIAGAVLATIGYGSCSMFNEETSSSKRIGYMILIGVGNGLTFQSMTLNAQVASPKHSGGVLITTAMVAFMRSLGGVIGSTLGQTIQSVVFKSGLQSVQGLPPGISADQLVNDPSLIWQLPPDIAANVISAFVGGFQKVMYFSLAFSLAAFFIMLTYSNKLIPQPVKPAPNDVEVKGVEDEASATDSNSNPN